jgi:outer membrane murein-binding lipoprotein Lpp
MKKSMILALAVGLLVVVGCGPEAKKESLAQEAAALKGGPMPAGTWDKIAAQRKAYDAAHGGAASGAPGGPSGGATKPGG